MPEKVSDKIQEVIQAAIPASCSIYVKTRKKSWSGSGFHIGNGYVVTASHVAPPEIQDSGEINLTFDQQIMYSAKIFKSDPNIDAAILQIQGDYSKITAVALANSDNLELGETVAVLGAPEGWHDTVSVGRISNMHQSMGSSAPSSAWNDVIFVDAKILQGVSGGMCIATDGLVIGSVIGVTGTLANLGIGENVICPSNKILDLIKSV
jgi:S1-C subfamily serine protease